MEPIEPVLKNIYQSNTYLQYLLYLLQCLFLLTFYSIYYSINYSICCNTYLQYTVFVVFHQLSISVSQRLVGARWLNDATKL